MKGWAGLLAALSFAAAAQMDARPQLAPELAPDYTVATYLAQGPSPWVPADSTALAQTKPDFTVAADGSGTHTTLQAAFDALPAASDRRLVIGIAPGIYRGQVCLRAVAPVALVGLGGTSADVRIVAARYAGEGKRPGIDGGNPCLPDLAASSYGTLGSATLGIFSNDVQLIRLSVENDAMQGVQKGIGYPVGAGESGGAQGVALMTQGDRIQLEDVRLIGHQDTLYVRNVPDGFGDRVYVRSSLIAGDVDFIFGNGTLVVDGSTILSRAGRRAPGNGGHILAPSTAPDKPLGILVNTSRLVNEAGLPAGTISLGRAWDQGVAKGAWVKDVSPNGQAVVRDSVLGVHVGPWAASTSRRPFSGMGDQANRLLEFNNVQLPVEQAPHGRADWSRETLATDDGWAAAAGGTLGGASATAQHVDTVRDRSELVAALTPGDHARVVKIVGRIDLSADADGRSLGYADYRDPEFEFNAFLHAYDPSTWGKNTPSGHQEEARQRSARRQAQQVIVRVPSRTTLVGIGTNAAIVNGTLMLDRVDNVIIRNIHFSDAYDYFPAWDPKDNSQGEWNSDYDNLTLRGSTHVWIDHCTFDDGARPDNLEPVYLGRRVQHHDGLLDITQQSNWVTVSWNHFRQHDKTTLVGSSDNQLLDQGKLKVTFHHNLYEEVKERTPRVRYGQVHLYNNLYLARQGSAYPYGYSIGVGVASQIVSEANVWNTPDEVPSSRLVRLLKGNLFSDSASLHNGQPARLHEALRASYPAVNVSSDVGWKPSFHLPIDPVANVETLVYTGAGVLGRQR